MSIRTIKLPYNVDDNNKDSILAYIRSYNNLLKFTYNRILDGITSTKELLAAQKTMNNMCLDTYFKSSAMYEAKALAANNKTLIFGGKSLFLKRARGTISKEEFQHKKLLPLTVIGIAHNNGNCKFQIIDESTILFKPDRYNHFYLKLPKLKKSYRKDILKLIELQNNKAIPITYKLSMSHVYISFENNVVREKYYIKPIKNRVFAIDINPNYIGYAVVDWKNSCKYKVVHAGVLSNKQINDLENSLKAIPSNHPTKLKLYNKRRYECIESAKWLVNVAHHYGCELFAVEQLCIGKSNLEKGSRLNRLVNNQWCRNVLYDQLKKRCELVGLHFQEVVPQYSSFIGNLAYRYTKLPDMCLSAIEIGRRGYEYYGQYILQDKPICKNIVLPNSSGALKDRIVQSLEELNVFVDEFDLVNIYRKLKTLCCKVRVPLSLSENLATVCSRGYMKSYVSVILYNKV